MLKILHNNVALRVDEFQLGTNCPFGYHTPIQPAHPILTKRITLSTCRLILTLIFVLLPMANAANAGGEFSELGQASVSSSSETMLGEIDDDSRSKYEDHAGLFHFSCTSCAAILSFPNTFKVSLDPLTNSFEFAGRFSGVISPIDLFRPPRL